VAGRATDPEFGGGRAVVPPISPASIEGTPPVVSAFLAFEPDGSVTAFSGKAEVGQNVRTSLAQAVADELRLPLERVRVVLGDTARVPFDRGTFGSRSTPDMAVRLRAAAATARETLIERAAERWEADTSALVVRDGQVVHAETSQALPFPELAASAPLDVPVLDPAPSTPADEWREAGQPRGKVNAVAMVIGMHHYASDVSRPGMVFGKVLRAPVYGARLRSLDARGAEALAGVTVVRDGDLVGVVAPSAYQAGQGLAALQVEWDLPPAESRASEGDLYERLRRDVGGTEGGRQLAERSRFEEGSVPDGLASASQVLRATYTVPYIAHAPLEPRAAVAEWGSVGGEPGGGSTAGSSSRSGMDGQGQMALTVWTGTQRPFGVQAELMALFGLPPERVRVIVPDTGAGYGGKHTGEAALEAARLARAVGRPVKMVWTREEEFTWAYLRPAGVMELAAGLDAGGRLVAWEHRCFNAGASALRFPYVVPNQVCEFVPSRSPLRQGSYRALAATANSFARECFLDELAEASGQDPLAFRLAHLPEGRLRVVLAAAAQAFGWEARAGAATGAGATMSAMPAASMSEASGTGASGTDAAVQATTSRSPSLGAGAGEGVLRGVGLACSTEKGAYVATCAEVAVDAARGAVRLTRAVTAFECGAVVNPDGLRNQIEGAVTQGIGGALSEAIHFAGGQLLNPRFSEYFVPRFGDVPPPEAVQTVLLNRKDLPSAGAGETPIIAIAPAIANALFAATGERRRALPLNEL
jgi:nicotinate dehydrogenase subunit B